MTLLCARRSPPPSDPPYQISQPSACLPPEPHQPATSFARPTVCGEVRHFFDGVCCCRLPCDALSPCCAEPSFMRANAGRAVFALPARRQLCGTHSSNGDLPRCVQPPCACLVAPPQACAAPGHPNSSILCTHGIPYGNSRRGAGWPLRRRRRRRRSLLLAAACRPCRLAVRALTP